MAELVMDNPLSPSPSPASASSSNRQIYAKIISDITECITELKKDVEDSGCPITDESQCLQRLCGKLEYLLRASLKPRTGLLGKKKDYWDFYCDCLNSNKSLNDGIKFVKSLTELKTSQGRGRAFIRFALVQQRLADTVQQCVCNTRITSEWYFPQAVWFQQKLVSELVNSLYDLNDLKFDLSPRGYDLDMSWPTFARPGFSSPGSQSWNLRGRTTSVSSLSSIPPLEVYPLPTEAYDSGRSAADAEEKQLLLEETMEQLDAMENNKLAAEAQSSDLQQQVEELKKQLTSEQERSSERQTRIESLQSELTSEKEGWKKEEEDLKTKLMDSEKQLVELCGTMGRVEEAMGQDMETTELKMKSTAQEKLILTLQTQLKTAQAETEQKTILEAKKSRLIELLDQKLSKKDLEIRALESRKQQLYGMAESMIKGKEQHAIKLNEATKQIEELVSERVESDKVKKLLMAKNAELEKALDNLQGKGSAIASIALEKVKKYKKESEALKSQLDERGDGEHDVAKLKEQLAAAEMKVKAQEEAAEMLKKSNMDELQEKLTQALAKVNKESKSEEVLEALGSLTGMNEDMKAAMEGLQREQQKREEAVAEEREGLMRKVKELERSNQELMEHVSGAQQMNGAASSEVDELRAQLKAKEEEVGKLSNELTSLKTAITSLIGVGQDMTDSGPYDADDMTSVLHAINTRLKAAIPAMENTQELLNTHKEALDNTHSGQGDFEVGKLKTLAEEKTEKVESLEYQLGVAQQKLEAADNEIKPLRERLCEFEEDTAMLRDTCKTLMEEKLEVLEMCNESKNRTAALEAEKSELVEKISELNSELADSSELLTEVKTERDSLKSEVDRMSVALSDVESVRQGEVQKSELVTDENLILKAKIQELENVVEKSEAQAKEEVESLMTKITKLEDDLEIMKKEIEEKALEKSKLVEQLTQLSEEKSFLDADLQRKTYDLKEKVECDEQHEENVLSLQTEISNLRIKVQELEFVQKAFNDISKDKSELENKAVLLQEQLDSVTDGYNSMKDEMVVISEALHQAHLGVIEGRLVCDTATGDDVPDFVQLQTDNVSLREKLMSLLSEKDKIFTNLIQQRTELKEEAEVANKCAEDLKIQDGILRENVTNLLEELSETRAEISTLQESLKQRETEVEALQQELSEHEGKKKLEVDDLKSDLEALSESTSHRERVWENARESMEAEITSLKFQLSSTQIDYNTKLQLYESDQSKTSSLEGKVSHQADRICGLEVELKSVTKEREELQEKHSDEVSELKAVLLSMEHDNSNLKQLIQKLQSEKQDEHQHRIVLEAELIELKQELGLQQEANLAECQDLKNENTQLKKKLIQLIKEKDSLWQMTDKLEYAQRQKSGEVWMDNKDTNRCLGCSAEFSLRLRKHHCRMCGKIFCHSCSNNFIMTPHSSHKERVCNACQLNVEASQSMDHTSLLGEHDALDSEEIPTRRSHKWQTADDRDTEETERTSTPDSPSQSASPWDNSDGAGTPFPEEENPEDEPSIYKSGSSPDGSPTTEPNSPTEPQSNTGSMSAITKATIGVTKAMMGVAKAAVNKAAYYTPSMGGGADVDSGRQGAETEICRDLGAHSEDDHSGPSSLAGVPRDSSGSDDTFDIVTQDEITTSRLDPLPDPNVISRLTVTAQDIAQEGGIEVEPDLWVAAGKTYAVPIVIDQEGIVLRWQFTTQPKGIHFSLTFRVNEFTALCDSEELIALCKCNSHKETVVGELETHRAGVYTLLFNNNQSRFTSKKLSLQLTVQGAV